MKKMNSIIKRLSIVIIVSLLIACGDANQNSNESATGGAISFNVTWVGAPTLSDNVDVQIRALDCGAAGIATVSFEVLDQNDNRLAYKEFNCSVGSGRVDDIAPGSNRTLIVRGLDSGGNETYRGTVSGIPVVLGEEWDAGEIACLPCEIWYEDSDSDTYGNPMVSQISCPQPAGYVLDNQDCDDSDVNEHPSQTWYADLDGDGYSDGTTDTSSCTRPTDYYLASELTAITGDCDDTSGTAYPGATEILDDSIDQDCDGSDQTSGATTWYRDSDTDGYGNPIDTVQSVTQPAGYVSDNTDCDDTDVNEHPNQTWYSDGDGDGYSNGTTNTASCTRPPNYYIASELTATTGDCDDVDSDEHPGQTWYHDSDGDTFGDNTDSEIACERPADHVLDNTDCDDAEITANPNGTEIECDSIDQDCSGTDLCATGYGLVAYYPFDGNANDESGNGNDGISEGGIIYGEGVNGQACIFNNVDTSIYLGENVFNESMQIAMTGSVSLWFNSDDTFVSVPYDRVDLFDSEEILRIRIHETTGGEIGANASNNGTLPSGSIGTGEIIENNRWYHVAMTWDVNQPTTKLYVNGEFVDTVTPGGGTNPISFNVRSRATRIGASWMGTNPTYPGAGRFKGAIDEVRIYNRALSPTEIKLLYEADYANSLGMTFKLIPSGIFTMGSPGGVSEYPIGSGITPAEELGREVDETPHEVTLTKSYYMMSTEVTQGQWEAVMGSNPSYFPACGSDCPVEQVSWNDAQTFIANLNAMGEGTYRLPTEAEWEYAARAGTGTAFSNGGITVADCTLDSNLDAIGWYCFNSSGITQQVAQKNANIWGLYDIHGNVWEWVEDWYSGIPGDDSVTDPTGPASGSDRNLRGGSWGNFAIYCRSAFRGSGGAPDYSDGQIGFRLVREYTGTNPYNMNLVAHYPFDGNANDTSGNSNDGTVNGATITTDRFGNTDSAYSFDGIDDYIDFGSDSNFPALDGPVSVSLWAKIDPITTTQGGQQIFGNIAAFQNHFTIGMRDALYDGTLKGAFWFDVQDADTGTRSELDSIPGYDDGLWHHVVAVMGKNGTTANTSLYVDGHMEVSDSITMDTILHGDTVKLAHCSVNLSERYINMNGDDIRIYDRALTAPEIQSLYRANGPPFTESQAISTVGATDWESFVIEGETYLAVANYYNDAGTFNVDSKIYKWNGSSFSEFQSIPTNGALDWESFTIDGEIYLAVANSNNDTTRLIDSKVYKWNGASFVEFQSIPTQGGNDWEYFILDGEHYLAIANYQGVSYNVDSVIYKWNGSTFIEFQSIATHGCKDWEDFLINDELYLVLANFYNESSWSIDSKIYKWNGSAFVEFQSIPTVGAVDWEVFSIAGNQYIAVANYTNGSTRDVDSKVYQWNGSAFIEIQSIPTVGAQDWENFSIAGDNYLAVSNFYNGISYNIDSIIYEWNEGSFSEIQAIATSAASDIEAFVISGETYLGIANYENGATFLIDSKIYK